jgi:hypothetical protein
MVVRSVVVVHESRATSSAEFSESTFPHTQFHPNTPPSHTHPKHPYFHPTHKKPTSSCNSAAVCTRIASFRRPSLPSSAADAADAAAAASLLLLLVACSTDRGVDRTEWEEGLLLLYTGEMREERAPPPRAAASCCCCCCCRRWWWWWYGGLPLPGCCGEGRKAAAAVGAVEEKTVTVPTHSPSSICVYVVWGTGSC